MRTVLVLLVVAGALAVVLGAALRATSPAPTVFTIHAVFAKSDLSSVAQKADAIAIVEAIGKPNDHWNSADNKRWGDIGNTSFIYRDTQIRVQKVLLGKLDSTLVVRGLGGTADNVELIFEDGGAGLDPGVRFLVFLERAAFPTKHGQEQMWTTVRLSQGIFTRDGAGWLEPIQDLRIADDDLATLPALARP